MMNNVENKTAANLAARRVVSAAVELDEITHATQYATARYNGEIFATVGRRRVYEAGPKWTVTGRDGHIMFSANYDVEFAYARIRTRLVTAIIESEAFATETSVTSELVELAERAADPTDFYSFDELTDYEKREVAARGFARGEGVKYEVRKAYSESEGALALVRFVLPRPVFAAAAVAPSPAPAATPAARIITESEVETALCIWEAMLAINGQKASRTDFQRALLAMWKNTGTVNMRLEAARLARHANAAWEALNEAGDGDDAPFDWEYIPAWLENCTIAEGTITPPQTGPREFVVIHSHGIFDLRDPETGDFVKSVTPPLNFRGENLEMAWFFNWCKENGISATFE